MGLLVRRGRNRAARDLLAQAGRLVAEQQLESEVLLDAANHYANDVHGIRDENQGRGLVRCLAHGYALRVAEEQAGAPRPAPLAVAAAIAAAGSRRRVPAAVVLATVDAAMGRAGTGPPAGLAPPRPLGGRGWRQAGEALCAEPAAADGDVAHALAYGYLVRCAEAGDGGALLAPDGPELPSVESLLHTVDALLAAGDALFAGESSRVALVLGVLHGLGLEHGHEAARETAVAAARAGYAFRRAEQQHGLAGAEAGAAPGSAAGAPEGVPGWDALQIAAWETRIETLPGHPERGAALAVLADAAASDVGGLLTGLSPADGLRAVRFGYALRAAAASPA